MKREANRKKSQTSRKFISCLSKYLYKIGWTCSGLPQVMGLSSLESLLPGTSATISEYLLGALNGASQVGPEWKGRGRGGVGRSSSQLGLE